MKRSSSMGLFFLLVGALVFLSSSAVADSCQIDLEDNSHNCQNVPAVKFMDGPADHKAVIAINLDPQKTGFKEATFDVEYKENAAGWTVNIGDSISNNGYAGDGANQSNDAELQILDNVFSVYGSDYIPPELRLLLKLSPVAKENAGYAKKVRYGLLPHIWQRSQEDRGKTPGACRPPCHRRCRVI